MADTQLIKEKLDIAQVVGEYIQLKKAGLYQKACCPFHREKTPSFIVNTERQSWKCFGCGKGGDIFSFVQEMEGLEFPEALKLLADKAGVKIDTFRSEVDKSQKNRIFEINEKAAYFFHRFLMDMPGAQSARDYIFGRGLKKETIEKWQIGFIPEQWDLLTKYLVSKGFGIDDILACGLTIKKDGASASSGQSFYDRFRGRIMFPICNVHGNVVGFTGRILVEKENSGGKYVNTPQTIVFDKSRLLYGLDKAKTEIKSQDIVVIVEGQMDVVACHQAGMKNVVASSGTALTHEQIKLLKRYSNNLAVAFDGDNAGIAAAKRGIDIALSEGMNVRVIRVPDGAGKDADECLKKNPTVWFESVKNAKEIMAWFFEVVFNGVNAHDPKIKQKIANELLPLIALIPFAVEKDHWLKELAERLGTETSVLREDIGKISKHKNNIATSKDAALLKPPALISRLEILLERLLMIFLTHNECINGAMGLVLEKYWQGFEIGRLYEILKIEYNKLIDYHNTNWAKIFSQSSLGELFIDLEMRAQIILPEYTHSELEAEIKTLIERIKEEWSKQQSKNLQVQIAVAEKNGDVDEVNRLFIKLQDINIK